MSELRIIIVGGGIAGLATAIALRAPNRRITVLERSPMLREVGALISLQPNATKILNGWNIDSFIARATPMPDRAFRLFDVDGNLVREITLDPSTFGADRMVYHRQDLHSALRDAATSSGEGNGADLPGPPAEVRTRAAVVACDPEKGTVTLRDGETMHADLIVGADGIHSVIRTAVLGEERKAVPTGISAYRMLLPSSRLSGIADIVPKDVFDPQHPATTMVVGHEQRVIMGPARDGEVFGIVALVPDEKMHEVGSVESWVEPGSLDKLLDSFAGFDCPWLEAVFRAAAEADEEGEGDGIALWQLRDLDPLPTWVKGRAILVGDASHAMLPTQGQGASQAIEDAEALRAFLRGVEGGDAEKVNRVLKRVEKVRYERASSVQAYSRQQARPATDGLSKVVKLDPAQFMKYNCDYKGALDWEKRQGLSEM